MKAAPAGSLLPFFACLLLVLPRGLGAQALDFASSPRTTDIAELESLPSIGLWMLDDSGSVAHWLGEAIQGRRLQEPINLVIVDTISRSGEEALARLTAACERSEFEKRPGHSDGYSAYIGGNLYPQLPQDRKTAYSDGPFEFSNNHGRVFGPAPWATGFVFTGAFSREHTNVVTKVKHLFASFNQARDAFARAMVKSGYYEIVGFLPLGNAIVGSESLTTGDHDGVAILLRAVPPGSGVKASVVETLAKPPGAPSQTLHAKPVTDPAPSPSATGSR